MAVFLGKTGSLSILFPPFQSPDLQWNLTEPGDDAIAKGLIFGLHGFLGADYKLPWND
jgi:hypothetical protein